MKRIAIVDTSTIIDLLTTKGGDASRKHARQHVAKVIADGGSLLVPSVVVAELHYQGTEGSKFLEQFGALAVGALRVVPLNQTAADIAGRMRAVALANLRKETGKTRGAVTYDALIAAIAVAQQATTLLTANARDYTALFKSVSSSVEVVDTRQAPKGQRKLFEDPSEKSKARAKR